MKLRYSIPLIGSVLVVILLYTNHAKVAQILMETIFVLLLVGLFIDLFYEKKH